MRIVVVCLAVLLLSGCAFVQRELAPAPPPVVTPSAKPDLVRPHKPHGEPPAQVQTTSPTQAAPVPPAPDYSTRCHAMAGNRADDAKQLGASATDQAKVLSDTYRDCMAQSVK
jgi:hypothetical protein